MAFNVLLSNIILQLCFASFGLAAPVSTEALDNSWQYGTGGGLIGLVVLILDIIVFGTSMLFSFSRVNLHLMSNHDRMLTLLPNSRGPQVEPHARPEAHLVPGRLPIPRYRHDRLLSLLEPLQLPARLRLRDVGVRARRHRLLGALRNDDFLTIMIRHEKRRCWS